MQLSQLQFIQDNFVKELQSANTGEKTSLAYLRNFIPTPFVKDDEVFQVIVVGGSICRNVLMKRNDGKYTILSHNEKEQPIFHTEKDFLTFLSLEIDSSVTHMALNFAFPIKPVVRDEKLDGILLYGTKEHTFAGLQGEQVGEHIETYMRNVKGQNLHVCVGNDTICLLLSGSVDHSWDKLACAIVGTGYNAAFFLSEHEAVNLESGGFNKLPQDDIDRKIDQYSMQPGMQLFEKQTSGGYLYHSFNMLVKSHGLSYPEIISTKSLDELARGSSEIGIYAKQVLEKSAQLAACQIAGIANFRQTDIVCVVEGSLFWRGYEYKETVEKTVKELCPDHTVTFIQVENSSVMGGAKLIA